MAMFFFLFFCLLAIVLVATAVGLNFMEARRKKDVKGLLQTVEGNGGELRETKILIEPPTPGTFLGRAGIGAAVTRSLETTIHQSGLNWPPGQLLVSMAIGGALGLLVGWKFNFLIFLPASLLVFAVLGGCLPYVYVRMKRGKRLAAFEEQFPEALDFLARSMRAGHAFSVSLEMLGTESPDPLGMEFRSLFNEQNLGAPIEVAFANMLRRLPLVDVRFFVSSVMLQKQTGGNLSEILVRLSYVIRERFRLKGQVKAASAHGRMTATILVLMPIVLMFALMFVAPGYLQSMANDPDGKYLILAAIIAQLLGYYFIRKIIRIKI
jgi:tight adherence protein B